MELGWEIQADAIGGMQVGAVVRTAMVFKPEGNCFDKVAFCAFTRHKNTMSANKDAQGFVTPPRARRRVPIVRPTLLFTGVLAEHGTEAAENDCKLHAATQAARNVRQRTTGNFLGQGIKYEEMRDAEACPAPSTAKKPAKKTAAEAFKLEPMFKAEGGPWDSPDKLGGKNGFKAFSGETDEEAEAAASRFEELRDLLIACTSPTEDNTQLLADELLGMPCTRLPSAVSLSAIEYVRSNILALSECK